MFTCLPWSGICCSAGKAVTVAADKSVGVIQSYSGWRVEACCSLLVHDLATHLPGPRNQLLEELSARMLSAPVGLYDGGRCGLPEMPMIELDDASLCM